MKITKRKAKGVLADMIADMDEDSLAKTREKMVGMSYRNTDLAACGHATCPSRESCLRWVIGQRMGRSSQGAGDVNTTAGQAKGLTIQFFPILQTLERILKTMTTTMETKKTDAVVELADNGYILRYAGTVLVYSDKTCSCYRDMIADLMQDLDNAIEAGGCSKIRVKVEVEPITDNDNEQKQ